MVGDLIELSVSDASGTKYGDDDDGEEGRAMIILQC